MQVRPATVPVGWRTSAILLCLACLLAGTLPIAGAPANASDEDDGAVDGEQAEELVVNADFADGHEPWWGTEDLVDDEGELEYELVDGSLCVDVPGDTGLPWDVIVGQDDLPVVEGEDYIFTFTAWGSLPRVARSLVQMPRPPWTYYVSTSPTLPDSPATYEVGFTAPETRDDAQIVFQVGGSDEPWTFCLESVSLVRGTVDPYEPDTGPRVRVNQVGYLPQGPKNATLVSDEDEPLDWELHDANGQAVASGASEPRGHDPTAGLDVHTIDFGGFTGEGDGFTLVADGERSHPFPIDPGIYQQLPVDTMSFFYPQRSGTEILGEVAGDDYARPAGHVEAPDPDRSGNQGDLEVPCLPAEEARAQYGQAMGDYGDDWPCDYTLDVVGGWYDAGDHGKYVVNGGISAFVLMSAYERALHAPTGDAERLGDGTLRVPEAGSGVPDILDEVRWQLEMLLRMQVPDGEPFAGMAHHKLHDLRWTGLPLYPHAGEEPRYLHPPTTAATLNLAASAAQGARLWEEYDQAFADELLSAARAAWEAANEHPDLLAPPPRHDNPGGGPYDDAVVTDEFYWAASQLYLTTGEQTYLDALVDNPRHTAGVHQVFRTSGAFDWRRVEGATWMSLALVPSDLPDRQRIVEHVIEGAELYLDAQAGQPFGQAYAPPSDRYDWGSNHLLANNLLVIATAYDLTGDQRYLDGVLEGLDYLFGRNALNLSYVTGYGTADVRNQHSRWYANQLDPTSPNPPPGSFSGGPNSSIQDPMAQRLLLGCPAQTCFLDDIESWSTNEITINWNASLSWLAAFVADQHDGSPVALDGDATEAAAGPGDADDAPAAGRGLVLPLIVALLAVLVLGVVVWWRRRDAAPSPSTG